MSTKRFLIPISLAAFMLVLALTGFSKEKLVLSKWTAQPPQIDGLDDDWRGDALTSEKKVKVDYAFRNDAQNMYVLFVFKDPKYLSTISATGITLYFNTEGKEKKDLGFHFIQKQVTPDELIDYLEKQGQALTDEQIQSIKAKPAYSVYMAERVGKEEEEASETARVSGAPMPGFKINRKGQDLIYEFRVPLVKSEASPEGMGVEPGQSLKIGFEWGGMTKELTERMSGRSGEDISREGGAGAVIDTRRDTGGVPRDSSRAMPKKYSLWADVKLAQRQ